jgi:hypothetical protein
MAQGQNRVEGNLTLSCKITNSLSGKTELLIMHENFHAGSHELKIHIILCIIALLFYLCTSLKNTLLFI